MLRSGMIDLDAGTITLPLYQGQMKDGRKVWYILTDTDDEGNADALGLNYAAKLTYAGVGKGARNATLEKNGTLISRVALWTSSRARTGPRRCSQPLPKRQA